MAGAFTRLSIKKAEIAGIKFVKVAFTVYSMSLKRK